MRSESNPAVNRSLADKAFDHIDHALGRPCWPLRESYRNYFATGITSATAKAFEASPHWELGAVDPGQMAYFHVTDEGRRALNHHLISTRQAGVYVVNFNGFERTVPARTAAKARYDYFLALRDIAPDLAFLDFASAARVRRAY